MHKERIIAGIEKVFEGYAKDEKLREALSESKPPHQLLQLFPKYNGCYYYLSKKGEFICFDEWNRTSHIVSSAGAANEYFRWLCAKEPGSNPELNLTLSLAESRLKADLGSRVEQLKKDYAQHPDV